jgi:carotenoid cleavage dioxygenase-like enzyme
MMITKSYIVFTIVPLEISVAGLVEGRDSIANLLSFDANQPTRIVAFRKDGVGDPIEIVHEKSTFVFHHCNAYEDEQTGHLVFHSCLYEDDEVLSVLGNWGQSATPAPPKGSLTRFEVDLASKKAVSRSEVFQGGIREFPCIDPALVGSENRYLHMLEAGRDFLVFDSVVCLDMKTGRETRMPAEQGHALGEPVFVANPARARGAESDGWILHLGYDGGSDQTYLDIRTPVTLERLARVHTERYFPLGFHGFFKQS